MNQYSNQAVISGRTTALKLLKLSWHKSHSGVPVKSHTGSLICMPFLTLPLFWRESQGDSTCYGLIGYYLESFAHGTWSALSLQGWYCGIEMFFLQLSWTFGDLWKSLRFTVSKGRKDLEGPSCNSCCVPVGTLIRGWARLGEWLSLACFLLLFNLLVFLVRNWVTEHLLPFCSFSSLPHWR